MKKLPSKITVTFTEEDRQAAAPYVESSNCIFCTAGRRLGLTVEDCDLFTATIGDQEYEFVGVFDSAAAHSNEAARKPPFYHAEIVGKTITLKRL